MHLPIDATDLRESRRLRDAGTRLDQCCPLAVALRRRGWPSPILTRRYVLLGGELWEPSESTRTHENVWAETGQEIAYVARLRPRFRDHSRSPEWRLSDPSTDPVAADRRAIHGTLERFANWPE